MAHASAAAPNPTPPSFEALALWISATANVLVDTYNTKVAAAASSSSQRHLSGSSDTILRLHSARTNGNDDMRSHAASASRQRRILEDAPLRELLAQIDGDIESVMIAETGTAMERVRDLWDAVRRLLLERGFRENNLSLPSSISAATLAADPSFQMERHQFFSTPVERSAWFLVATLVFLNLTIRYATCLSQAPKRQRSEVECPEEPANSTSTSSVSSSSIPPSTTAAAAPVMTRKQLLAYAQGNLAVRLLHPHPTSTAPSASFAVSIFAPIEHHHLHAPPQDGALPLGPPPQHSTASELSSTTPPAHVWMSPEQLRAVLLSSPAPPPWRSVAAPLLEESSSATTNITSTSIATPPLVRGLLRNLGIYDASKEDDEEGRRGRVVGTAEEAASRDNTSSSQVVRAEVAVAGKAKENVDAARPRRGGGAVSGTSGNVMWRMRGGPFVCKRPAAPPIAASSGWQRGSSTSALASYPESSLLSSSWGGDAVRQRDVAPSRPTMSALPNHSAAAATHSYRLPLAPLNGTTSRLVAKDRMFEPMPKPPSLPSRMAAHHHQALVPRTPSPPRDHRSGATVNRGGDYNTTSDTAASDSPLVFLDDSTASLAFVGAIGVAPSPERC